MTTYRIFENTGIGDQDIYIEFAANINLEKIYSDFSIDSYGRAITFTGKNTINFYQSNTAFYLDFQRQFPMFRFYKNYAFSLHPITKRPMFQYLED